MSVVGQLMSDLYTTIAGLRATLGFPPLVGGDIHCGQEYLYWSEDCPRIVAVPRGTRFEPARRQGINASGLVSDMPAAMMWWQWLRVEFHCWGDPDPAGVDLAYDFDTSLELVRELLYAMIGESGGIPNVKLLGTSVLQPTNELRRGRCFVLTAEVPLPAMDQPYVIRPFATASTSGVEISATVQELNPASGTPTIVTVIVAPPP